MIQEQEQRWFYHDGDLKVEAYNLSGVVQEFPNHFHKYYVIGFAEGGKRHLWCRNREYDAGAEDLILFNPRDNHYCASIDREPLDYHTANIELSVIEQAVKEITGREFIPHFTQNVAYRNDIAQPVSGLYSAILRRASGLEKKEALFFLSEQVFQKYVVSFKGGDISKPDDRVQNLYTYMGEHFPENISLDELLSMTTSGKSYLLRSSIKQVGAPPCRYLQAIRLDKTKKFLGQGIPPVKATTMTGFSDQSHFTNLFKELIGLIPRQY